MIRFDVVEAHCYIVIIGRAGRGRVRGGVSDGWFGAFRPRGPLSTAYKTFVCSWQRPTWPKRPASVAIDSAMYLLMFSSPDVIRFSVEWRWLYSDYNCMHPWS